MIIFMNFVLTRITLHQPLHVVVASEIEVPEIPESLVWKSLSNMKRTAMGPDRIPFWVWKEHAKILMVGRIYAEFVSNCALLG